MLNPIEKFKVAILNLNSLESLTWSGPISCIKHITFGFLTLNKKNKCNSNDVVMVMASPFG